MVLEAMSQYSLARSRLVKFFNLTSPTKRGFPIRGRFVGMLDRLL